ncbi:hypothetical protein [Aquibacillus rhizosphaerae]|uniref:Uncharacterized protein n=1 Tax=Aquibacillus rhizosphaerae TaxID=3051431 RepID=A0ABT7L952_9BACI|nr:hypothetical protein [Aquibacillus sp. LR5S19]MDL4842387.1 hypothetical protein [Aquibacillus sp. LR5S19]
MKITIKYLEQLYILCLVVVSLLLVLSIFVDIFSPFEQITAIDFRYAGIAVAILSLIVAIVSRILNKLSK